MLGHTSTFRRGRSFRRRYRWSGEDGRQEAGEDAGQGREEGGQRGGEIDVELLRRPFFTFVTFDNFGCAL